MSACLHGSPIFVYTRRYGPSGGDEKLSSAQRLPGNLTVNSPLRSCLCQAVCMQAIQVIRDHAGLALAGRSGSGVLI